MTNSLITIHLTHDECLLLLLVLTSVLKGQAVIFEGKEGVHRRMLEGIKQQVHGAI